LLAFSTIFIYIHGRYSPEVNWGGRRSRGYPEKKIKNTIIRTIFVK